MLVDPWTKFGFLLFMVATGRDIHQLLLNLTHQVIKSLIHFPTKQASLAAASNVTPHRECSQDLTRSFT